MFGGEAGRLVAISGSSFSQNATDMVRDCFNADEKRVGNLLIGLTEGNMPNHFDFPLAEAAWIGIFARRGYLLKRFSCSFFQRPHWQL